MITAHALNILILALAFAFVLICAGVVYLQHQLNKNIANVNERIDALEAAHSRAGEQR